MINIKDIMNVEICMIEELQKQLSGIHSDYMSMYKSIEGVGTGQATKSTLEDILITNDKIKRKLISMLASRDGVQSKIIEHLKQIR